MYRHTATTVRKGSNPPLLRSSSPWVPAALLLLGIVLLSGCGGSGAGDGSSAAGQGDGDGRREAQRPLAVEALTVSEGRLINRIEGSGTVAGIREALVVSETQGIVEGVRFELGAEVAKGEVLVQVDDEIARLNMEQAAEQLETARIDYTTKQNLAERGGSSRAEVARARSALRGAEARYRKAVDAFENCSISAPIAGSIASKEPAASIGNYLNPGMQIARITDLSRLRMEVSIGEGLIGLVAPGAAARVTVPAACGQAMEATVAAVAAGSNPATGSYTAVLEWENRCPDSIKAGMSARAEIEPRVREAQLVIPSAALANRGGEQVVFLASEGLAEMREVRVARREGNLAAINAGLQGGETLIISGIGGLSEGDPVEPTILGESGQWE